VHAGTEDGGERVAEHSVRCVHAGRVERPNLDVHVGRMPCHCAERTAGLLQITTGE
jgi:hypothetical protein